MRYMSATGLPSLHSFTVRNWMPSWKMFSVVFEAAEPTSRPPTSIQWTTTTMKAHGASAPLAKIGVYITTLFRCWPMMPE